MTNFMAERSLISRTKMENAAIRYGGSGAHSESP